MSFDEPITLKDVKYKHLLGLVTIHYIVEDRGIALDDATRYKHLIYVRILNRIYSWVLRSRYPYEDVPFVRKK